MDRRRFLGASGLVIVAAISGCGGEDGGNGGQYGGETPTQTATETATTTEEPTDTETAEPTETETTTTTEEENGDQPTFGAAVNPAPSFAYSGEYTDPDTGEEATIEGRVHQGDSYSSVTFQGETFEIYVVDDDTYLVMGDQCLKNPASSMEPQDPEQDPEGWDEDVDQYRDLKPDGITTVDGEEAYYWEIEEDGDQITYYVSLSTRRLLRVEFPTGRIDYHSWGSVDPIEPPDMDCGSV